MESRTRRTPARTEQKDVKIIIKRRTKEGEKAPLSFQDARKWSGMLLKSEESYERRVKG